MVLLWHVHVINFDPHPLLFFPPFPSLSSPGVIFDLMYHRPEQEQVRHTWLLLWLHIPLLIVLVITEDAG